MTVGIGKKSNEYADSVCDIDASKTVWMAIAYSFATRLLDEEHPRVSDLILNEWSLLHRNGIVPQKPRVVA